jgi:Ca2+-binding RTX toxin-like protein
VTVRVRNVGLIGTNSNDEIYGNGGDDRIEGRNGDDRIWGGSGNDRIWGENGSDRIIGDEGDDEVNGGGNDDYLWGSQGNDKLWGEDGNDELRGDDGNDELRGGGNNDKLWGGNGDDKIWGENDNDELYGESGNDELNGGNNDDRIWGGSGNDRIWGENGSDRIIGDEGDDEVNGGGNDDYLWGSQGNDKLWGEDGNDELRGDDGNDELRGGGNNDKLWGGNGDDKIWGENDNDELYGESGNDELNGGRNDDRIFGGSGNDRLWGESGNDALYGDDGDDILDGYGNGDNERDILAGWAGRDRFILSNSDNVYYRRNGRNDFAEILSFNRDEDTIQLKSLSNNVSNGSKAYGYRLVTVGSDTEIRVDSNDDLIAILRGVTGISLTGKGFAFDGSSPQEIIKQLYRDVFGREADSGGLQISSNQLASGVMTYEQIRQFYAYSPEGKDKINQIYQDVLWRAADQGGLDYYRNSLATGTTLAQIRSSIASSQEAKKFWTIQYYNNTNLDGDVVFAQSLDYGDRELSKDWGSDSPNNAVNRDNFSARATTKRYFTPGINEIQTTSDDGIRVWINNQLVIDKWIDQASSRNYGYFNTPGGTFDVTIDYYERGGNANLSFNANANTINGSIGNKYRELGGASSPLGLPINPEFHDNDNLTIRRQFQGGQIVNNKFTGETEAIYNGDLPSWLRYESLAKEKVYGNNQSDYQLLNYDILGKPIENLGTGFYAIGLISNHPNDGRASCFGLSRNKPHRSRRCQG